MGRVLLGLGDDYYMMPLFEPKFFSTSIRHLSETIAKHTHTRVIGLWLK